MNDVLLLFSTGEGHDSGWLSTHARAYPASMLKSIKPYGKNTLNLFFTKGSFEDVISLSIENGKHIEVMRSIWELASSDESAVVIANVGTQQFANRYIYEVTLKNDPVLAHTKVSTAVKAKLNVARGVNEINSMTIANIHSSDATVNLYLVRKSPTESRHITATDVYAAENEAISTGSVTLTVDNGSGSASDAADDELKDELIYKSDNTLFGTCSTVSSTTALVFATGLSNAITDNDILHVGTRFYIFKSLVIPTGQTLKLEKDELCFDVDAYEIWIKLGDSTPVDVIIR